jgi:hypothetical protein
LGVEATFMGRLSSNGDLYFRSRDNDYEAINPGSAVGLIGLSRSSSSFYTSRVAGVNANQNRTSQVPTDRNIFVFAATADPDRPSNGRLSFYSIGEALDLALLDTRVSQLMTDIDNAIPYDADAVDYFNRVEGVSGDNQELEPAVKTAINDFIVGCKADGVWNAIKSSAILAGARTLTGALQPLKGTAPTNNNFVSGDYNRKTGLVGDGSTKYLNSNRNNNADPQDNKHLSVFASTSFDSTVIGAFDGVSSNGASWLARDATTTYVRLNAGSSYSTVEVAATGFVGASRSSSSTISRRVFGTTTPAINQNSVIPSNTPVTVFRQGLASQFSNSRLAFYSIGESLNLALLDTRVSQLMTDLNNIIP